jgi:hypothetical protein
MLASFAGRCGRILVTGLSLLWLSCGCADATPMSAVSPSGDDAALDLRPDPPAGGGEAVTHWNVPTIAPIDQPKASVEALDAPHPGLGAAMSFPGGDAADGGGATPLPERASGETLKDVLRSIATIHRAELRRPGTIPLPEDRPAAMPATFEDASDVQAAGLAELLLDSELAGAMLRSLVKIKSADSDGATFSILSSGDFVLDVSPGASSGRVTELSTGLSFGTANGYSIYSDYTASGGEGRVPRQRVNVLRLAWDWCVDTLFSPAGILLSTITIILFLSWACVRLVDRGASTRPR